MAPPTEQEIETAVLTAASTVTLADLKNLVEFFVKLAGGHDNAAALLEASREATRVALDVAEDLRLQKEALP